MNETNACPRCGAPLTAETLLGLCAQCLLQQGLKVCVSKTTSSSAGSQQPFVPPTAEELTPFFPHLEITKLLGQGGMGAVYQARQKKLNRLIALKIIRPEAAADAAFAERFNREARTLARLNHPAIVGIHDFGEVNGFIVESGQQSEQMPNAGSGDAGSAPSLYYFLMEYVDGASLRQLMDDEGLEPQLALSIVTQICDALQYAHSEGVVHRDIKPENILVDARGQVKIADFGLAKLAQATGEDFTLTGTHQVMGTPRYMAPEQMDGAHSVDHRADIYSLGVVFYEMLTGQVPAGHFEPPSQKVQVDVRLDDVVLRSMAREPEHRYQQAHDIRTDVEAVAAVASTDAVATKPVDSGTTNKTVKRPPRWRRLGVGLLAVAVGVAVMAVAARQGWLPHSIGRYFGGSLGRTPLVLASLDGDTDRVAALLQAGADPNEQSPLFWATAMGYDQIVRQLLDSGARIDQPFSHGITPLMLAAAAGRVTTAALLIENGANVNAQGDDIRAHSYVIIGEGKGRKFYCSWPGPEMTPVMLAAHEGHVELVSLLLESGADISLRDARGRTAAEIAQSERQQRVTKLFEQLDENPSADNDSKVGSSDSDGALRRLFLAAEAGQSGRVRELLDQHPLDVNDKDSNGKTALMYASENAQVSAVLTLMLLGASTREVDSSGQNAMMLAISAGHFRVVEAMLDLEKFAAECLRQTPTAEAAATRFRSFPGVDQRLLADLSPAVLDFELPLNAQDNLGETALIKAAKAGSGQTVLMLSAMPLRTHPGRRDKSGQNALMHAVRAGHRGMLLHVADEGSHMVVHNDIGGLSFPSCFFFPSVVAGSPIVDDTTVSQFLIENGMPEVAAALRPGMEMSVEVCTHAIENPDAARSTRAVALQYRAEFQRELGRLKEADADQQETLKLQQLNQ